MSARLVSCCEVDMSLPYRLVIVAPSVAASRCKDNTGRRETVTAATTDTGAIGSAQQRQQRSPPRRAVLLVLRLDRVARLVPVGVTPVAQLVEIAAHGERLCTVHGDGL